MVFQIKEKPKCANPKCNNSAIILIGRLFFCGDCAMKIMAKKEKAEEAKIMEMLQDD